MRVASPFCCVSSMASANLSSTAALAQPSPAAGPAGADHVVEISTSDPDTKPTQQAAAALDKVPQVLNSAPDKPSTLVTETLLGALAQNTRCKRTTPRRFTLPALPLLLLLVSVIPDFHCNNYSVAHFSHRHLYTTAKDLRRAPQNSDSVPDPRFTRLCPPPPSRFSSISS